MRSTKCSMVSWEGRLFSRFFQLIVFVYCIAWANASFAQTSCPAFDSSVGTFTRGNITGPSCGGGPSPTNGINISLFPGDCQSNGVFYISGQDGGAGEPPTYLTCTGGSCVSSGTFFSLAPGTSTNLTAQFNVNGDTTLVEYQAPVSRSADGNTCTYGAGTITGGNFGGGPITGLAPDMTADFSGTNVPFSTSSTTSNGTDFGNVGVNDTPVTRTFTLKNSGSGNLEISSIAINVAGAFTITNNPAPITLVANATTSFNVTFDPTTDGGVIRQVHIASNTTGHTVRDIQVDGVGVSPEISVEGAGNNINDGATPAIASNDTDFGSAALVGGTVVKTFTIKNTGTGPLSVGAFTLGGTNAADFTVTTAPAASVAASGSTTFNVTFDPSALGARNATISFVNGDSDENPFNYAIAGTGVDGTAPRVTVLDTILASPTNATSLTWTVNFDEPVANVNNADFAVTGPTGAGMAVAQNTTSTYTVTVTSGNLASYAGNVTLGFVAGQDITDTAGNALASLTPTTTDDPTYTYDAVAPTVVISGVPANSNAPYTATFTFSESVTGF
ncbi:MAG: choice-of-anchor D domain-containing protein, partial [Flavobacteriales bacterium]